MGWKREAGGWNFTYENPFIEAVSILFIFFQTQSLFFMMG
jgi:hypothetical protein